jgi:choline dehydrogenase-like flavoprotein
VVHYNYLREPEDRRRMRDGVRLVAGFLDHPAYRGAGATQTTLSQGELEDDATLDDWIATHLYTSYHSAGTCKMGPDSDDAAVVDQHCRVRGVDRLRVADVSIIPG